MTNPSLFPRPRSISASAGCCAIRPAPWTTRPRPSATIPAWPPSCCAWSTARFTPGPCGRARPVSGQGRQPVPGRARGGGRQLSTLALGVSVLPLFQDIPASWVNMRMFWEHSVGCAVAAQAIADACGAVNPETACGQGSAHDIGRIILSRCPGMGAAMRRAMADREPWPWPRPDCWVSITRSWAGCCSASGSFRPTWRSWCATTTTPTGPRAKGAAVIHLADVVANAMAWGGSGGCQVPPLSGPA